MNRRSVWAVLACVALTPLAAMTVYSQEKPEPDKRAEPDRKSAEFREKFLEEFRRTGLATTPEDSMLLRILVQARGAKRGIEVGTERGFGAINMGIAFERNGGRLWTIEIDPATARQAKDNIRTVGLEEVVTVIEGDALKELPKLAAEGEYDFVFIDALKRDYLKYFQAVEAKLKVGAVVVADNAIRSAGAMKDFLDFMKTSPDWEMVVVQASAAKNDGMAVCCKVR